MTVRLTRLRLGLAVLAVGLGSSAARASQAETALTQPMQAKACPAFLDAGARCFNGQDARGAWYWIAIPKAWNGSLVVHAHGGPRLKTPQPDDALEDLERFSVTVKEGFAWAGSNYRRPGYGVSSAAEDTDALRQIFWDRFGRPRRTFLHGQSWGGNVAAKTAELYGEDQAGKLVYDGMLLTNAVLAGGTRAYDFRADLRAVYQYYCKNHPGADEPDYPLWKGLPAGSTLTNRDLATRVNACTGVDRPADQRTAQQQQALSDILAVVRIPERTLVSHLNWATFTFRDLVGERLGGLNPFSNVGVRYSGSHDDAALNRGVARFAADPKAVSKLAADSDLSGRLLVPTLTLHAKDDPTAFVEMEHAFRAKVVKAGFEDLLVQAFTNEDEHSKLATPQYAAMFRALNAWVEEGRKPTPSTLAALCETAQKVYGEACHFDPGFSPQSLDARSYKRRKPRG